MKPIRYLPILILVILFTYACLPYKANKKADLKPDAGVSDRISASQEKQAYDKNDPTPVEDMETSRNDMQPQAENQNEGNSEVVAEDKLTLDEPLAEARDFTSIEQDSADGIKQELQPAETDKDVKAENNHQKKQQPILDEALDFCDAAQVFWQKGELENALEALDKAYSLILSINNGENPIITQQKEDLRYLISKRILEIYASRNIVVNGNHNAIPLEINRHIQAEIDRFTKGSEKSFFIESYKRSGKYRSQIVQELNKAGLPEELSWIPLIESGFKVKALSRARALGLWQFIPSTGYKFGLKRDKYVDERIDPGKATTAAIAYLKELHSIFGDWSTVLAAYNCGEGRVLRVIRTQNINYLDDFWDLYQRLPRETARYVPRFLATLHIVSHLDKYGYDTIEPYPPLNSETVEIKRQVHLKDVAAATEIPLRDLKDLNPELRYSILPQSKYPLKLPAEKKDLLLAKLDTIPISTPPKRAYVYHRVRKGETLSTIARRYRTRVSKIMRANNMRKSNYIVAGKRIKIPQRGVIISHVTKPAPKKSGELLTHYVKSGDSLWIIAKR